MGPPSPTGTYDCRANKKAAIGRDINLEYTGDDISSCTSACDKMDDCLAVYWHKTDSHCHAFTGNFRQSEWEDSLWSNSHYDSCFKRSSPRPSPPGPDAAFEEFRGYLGSGDDIKQEWASVAQAESECAALPNCVGFTFQGSGQSVAISLKNVWKFTP